MKAIITDRDCWEEKHQNRFGDSGSLVDVPDNTDEFLSSLEDFGRFEFFKVEIAGTLVWRICFHSSYD